MKYNEDIELTAEQIESLHENFDEFVESVMFEAIKHMTSKEKLDAKKYRNSASGKKAIAKYLKKAARAGYKVNKALSKKMKQVAKFRNEEADVDLVVDYMLDKLTEENINAILAIESVETMTEEQKQNLADAIAVCEEAFEAEKSDDEILGEADNETIAEIDELVEQIISFCEACADDEVSDIDPETGEKLDELKHMSSAAKMKAKKYRNSAAGKKAIAKYLKKSSKAGYKVDKKRSKLASKVAKFRNESKEEQFDAFDMDFLNIVLDAEDIIKEYQEAGIDIAELREACKAKNEADEVTIVIPLENEDDITAAADETEVTVVKKDTEEEACFVKGSVENLAKFIEKLGYTDSVSDLTIEEGCPCFDDDDDTDDMDEAFKRASAAKRALQRKAYKINKNKASFKKSRAKYARKRAKAGYKVDKNRSREMTKIAKTRVESIENYLDEQFKASPIFGSLNEGETNELKAMFTNAVTDTLMKSYESIEKEIREGYEAYIEEDVKPEMLNCFDSYKNEIARQLFEMVDDYITEQVKNFITENKDKKIFVKSAKSEMLENFSDKLISLIKDELKIIPEQEDALQSAKETIAKLSENIKESEITIVREKMKALNAQKDAHLHEALQKSNASDSIKDKVSDYALENLYLDNISLDEFVKKFDTKLEESIKQYADENKNLDEQKKTEQKTTTNEAFDFSRMFGRNI